MSKVLVTGATGFIGNYVVEELLSLGFEVMATSAHADKARQCRWFSEVEYREFDLKSRKDDVDYYDYFGRPGRVIHLAWEGLPNYQSNFHVEENLPRHFAFLQQLIAAGVKDITVTGTCFEYGMQQGCLHENLPPAPGNAYAKAKNELRLRLEHFMRRTPFSLKWMRLFYMYGRGQSPNSLFSQLEAALERGDAVFNMSGGEQLRDYLPVERMAGNIVRAAIQDRVTGIINNCSGVPVTVRDLVNDYLTTRGKRIALNLGYYPYPDYEPMAFWGGTEKLNLILSND